MNDARLTAIEAVLAWIMPKALSHADLQSAVAALTGPPSPADNPEVVAHLRRILDLVDHDPPGGPPSTEGEALAEPIRRP